MSSRISTLSRILQSPGRILSMMLLVVFAVEVLVMIILPAVVPSQLSETGRALFDAGLLTVVCAPVIWWLIVGPLRQIAIQEHARSEMIVENAVDGILTINRQRKITSANRAAQELFGIPVEELVGTKISTLISQFDPLVSSNVHQFESDGIRQDGSRFPMRISISEFPSDDDNSLIVIFQDVTDLHRMEEERVLAAREREALRTQQMITLAELATGVAHEIRNPLTSIKMLIQVNRDKFAEKGLPTDDLDLVVQEIRRMERSVNGLLEYGRPEQGEATEFQIQEVIKKTTRLIGGRCDESEVRIVVNIEDGLRPVEGDAVEIQQLLLNLCLNAIDAMPSGGTLRLSASAEAGKLCIQVEDSGSGIDEKVLDKLFSPFVTTKATGVGLGLGICRRIAESHGGTLLGHNRDEGGAQFQLILPFANGRLNEGIN